MRLSRAIVLALACLIADGVTANDRVDIQVRLVLEDQCTIKAGDRTRAEAVEVECSSGEPYRLDIPIAGKPRPVREAPAFVDTQHPPQPGLAIMF